MYTLGIETSCDETGIAVYDSQFWENNQPPHLGILGQSLYSQVKMHEEYGGVVPELASRDHVKRILPLIQSCLKESGLAISQIDNVAYTKGPGLAGALLVGSSVAKGLAFALNKKSIGIHHLEGHLLSPLLSERFQETNPKNFFPFLALLVSGGHTQIMMVKAIGDYTILGETLDDAVGEAFDKTAKLLDLPYPGGPAISNLALSSTSNRFKLPRPLIHSKNLDFSFAGLKTAVLAQIKQAEKECIELDSNFKADLAKAFVEAAVDVLQSKVEFAMRQTNCYRLVVAGGVGANQQLREKLSALLEKLPQCEILYPPTHLCTDNGVMIAFAASLRILQNNLAFDTSNAFDVLPRWPLDKI
jgi:N6-L-threonylcarbamoyladenine synthase